MSAEAMSKAFLALKAEVLRDDFSNQEWSCFKRGWEAAMKFMASPRMPCPHPTDPLQRQYYVPPPTIKWSEEENEILRRAAEAGNPTPKEHNPHGLVAFYTDAPAKPWGNPEGYVDHPKGCACGVCEQEEEEEEP